MKILFLLTASLLLINTGASNAQIAGNAPEEDEEDREELIRFWNERKESEIRFRCFNVTVLAMRRLKNGGAEPLQCTRESEPEKEGEEYLMRRVLGSALAAYGNMRDLSLAHDAARETCIKLLNEARANLPM